MGQYDDYYDRQDEYRREDYRRQEYRREDYARDDRRYDEIREQSTREMYEHWDNQDARRDEEERTTQFYRSLRKDDTAGAMDALGLGLEYRRAQADAATSRSPQPEQPWSGFPRLLSGWPDLPIERSTPVCDSDEERAESGVSRPADQWRRMTEIDEQWLHWLPKPLPFRDRPGS